VAYKEETPIIGIDAAIEAKSFAYVNPPADLSRGDYESAIKDAKYSTTNTHYTPSQIHFYMETQAVLAVPDAENDQMSVYCSAQDPPGTRDLIATVLGKKFAQVDVTVKRLGGGFGGKIRGGTPLHLSGAMAAHILNRPVRVQLDRETDSVCVGKRVPFKVTTTAGWDDNYKINAVKFEVYSDAGCVDAGAGGYVSEAFTYIDGCYYFPNFLATGKACLTNTVRNTAMRGPVGPQSAMITEHLIQDVACAAGVDPKIIRDANMYTQGQETPYGESLDYLTLPQVMSTLEDQANFNKRAGDVEAFNAANTCKKKGLAMVPCKYGFGWAGADHAVLVNCFRDGTVQVVTSAVEMGQGATTKVVQVAAYELGIPMDEIFIKPTSTNKIPDFIVTGGSIASELAAMACQKGCQTLMQRLAPFQQKGGAFADWCSDAIDNGVSLSASSMVWPDDSDRGDFQYYSYNAACTEVRVCVSECFYMCRFVDIYICVCVCVCVKVHIYISMCVCYV
jgi:xanthine dehydrogenase/oxidase